MGVLLRLPVKTRLCGLDRLFDLSDGARSRSKAAESRLLEREDARRWALGCETEGAFEVSETSGEGVRVTNEAGIASEEVVSLGVAAEGKAYKTSAYQHRFLKSVA